MDIKLYKKWTDAGGNCWEFECRDKEKIRLLEVSISQEGSSALITEYSAEYEDLDYAKRQIIFDGVSEEKCENLWNVLPYVGDRYVVQIREPVHPQKTYRNGKGLYIVYRGHRLYLKSCE